MVERIVECLNDAADISNLHTALAALQGLSGAITEVFPPLPRTEKDAVVQILVSARNRSVDPSKSEPTRPDILAILNQTSTGPCASDKGLEQARALLYHTIAVDIVGNLDG